ncbi:MAG: hypothetical protein OIN86_03330 [Candidatus Methanoperedens sp.]|nr:hypothetical protein [Candidatus Methanoperedens sp.]CAG0961235.1 hypothetical protein METP1_00730 [Methanosarcinales archaeon]
MLDIILLLIIPMHFNADMIADCNNKDALGCTISEFNSSGTLQYAHIYISNFTNYSGCHTKTNIIYHELGHVSFYIDYGDSNISSEPYAIAYANNISKDNC